MANKKQNAKVEFVLTSEEMINFCHDEIVALAAKMAEFGKRQERGND
jgi:hypothetical protein